MKFRAKQFCSGYMYFTFEAKDVKEAEKLLKLHNEGQEDVVELKQEGFDAEDGGEVHLVGKVK